MKNKLQKICVEKIFRLLFHRGVQCTLVKQCTANHVITATMTRLDNYTLQHSLHKKAWFDTKMPGSTQKCPYQHASIAIAITPHPPDSSEKYFFSFIKFFFAFKNPRRNLFKHI